MLAQVNLGSMIEVQLEDGLAAKPSSSGFKFSQIRTDARQTAKVTLNDCLACRRVVHRVLDLRS